MQPFDVIRRFCGIPPDFSFHECGCDIQPNRWGQSFRERPGLLSRIAFPIRKNVVPLRCRKQRWLFLGQKRKALILILVPVKL